MLHIERLVADIDALSVLASKKRRQCDEGLHTARQWLEQALSPAELRAHLAPVVNANTDWTGALPATDVKVNARFTAPDRPQFGTTLIAADGSQIFPDRHAAALYYLIQIGGMVFRYNGSTPSLHSRASLYFQDSDVYDERGYLISAEKVGVQRLVQEMAYLAELAAAQRCAQPEAPSFALTDGPLLWPYPERGKGYAQALQAYLNALREIQHAQTVPVGYVDRPGGHAVLDLLWAGQLQSKVVLQRVNDNPLGRLTDHELMAHVLLPGERSAWFTRPTLINRRHTGAGQEIWFCYLNVGEEARPVIARVEIPAWAAGDEGGITMLHTVLYHQARTLGGYPYALARAHEEALITTQDKVALDNLIQRRLIECGVMAQLSEKARQKSYLGRR